MKKLFGVSVENLLMLSKKAMMNYVESCSSANVQSSSKPTNFVLKILMNSNAIGAVLKVCLEKSDFASWINLKNLENKWLAVL